MTIQEGGPASTRPTLQSRPSSIRSQLDTPTAQAEAHQAEIIEPPLLEPDSYTSSQRSNITACSRNEGPKRSEKPPGDAALTRASQNEKLEPIYVAFEDDDPENPFNWSWKRKWIITWLGTWLTTLVAIAGPGFVIGVEDLQRDLGASRLVGALAFSLYPLGFATGPLVLAPLSEIYGRNPMYVGSTILFTLLYLPIALAPNLPLICVFRFFAGVAGSVGSTMVGGTLADIWVARERGKPMAIFSVGTFAGTSLGPTMFGFVAENLGWRWIQWIEMMMAGVTVLIVLLLFRETRGSVILSKRAARLRKETGNPRILCKADEERASLSVLIKTGVSRPLWFLLTEPIVLSLSIWIGFSWGCLFGLTQAIGLVYKNVYGWSTGIVGLAFIPIFIGALVGWVGNFWQEKMYEKHHATKGMEARLYGSMVGGIMFAIGCMIFAWSIKGHWIGPMFGIVILIFGKYCIYQGVFTYLADAYTIYASSAMSAQSFSRNVQGFLYPLFTPQMYNNLGYSWAAFLISMIAFVLSIIPFVLFKYGRRIRAQSPAAIELARQLEESERKRIERQKERPEKWIKSRPEDLC